MQLTRRHVLHAGGAAVVGSVALAACANNRGKVAESGTGRGTTTTTTTAAPASADLALLRTVAALELAAVATYQEAITSGLVVNQLAAGAAALFQQHHQQHADLLNAAVTRLGGTAVVDPLPAAVDLLQSADLTSELTIVQFARVLENVAAATYVSAAARLSVAELRQAAMSIGGVEARHVAAFDLVMQSQLSEGSGPAFESGAFFATEAGLSEGSYLPH